MTENTVTGMVTKVQRMSIHDGPGIRTTLFLKGCNFRCRWCHNPETWRREAQLERIAERCIACGACVPVCRTGALRPEEGGIGIDRERCDACGLCAAVCPARAMHLVGREVSADGLMRELRRDVPYFEESGGGVTLSGGEPLLQPAFVREVLSRCRAEGIPTAVETNLSVPSELIEELLPLVGLWMCDLKLADDSRHRRWTGVQRPDRCESAAARPKRSSADRPHAGRARCQRYARSHRGGLRPAQRPRRAALLRIAGVSHARR